MTASQRMYLKSVYSLTQSQNKVLSVDVANMLEVSRASVCKAMKILCENGYIYDEYQSHILLTAKGKNTAKEILEEESIVADFFIRTLHMALYDAKKCAAEITHILDSETLNKMKSNCNFRSKIKYA